MAGLASLPALRWHCAGVVALVALASLPSIGTTASILLVSFPLRWQHHPSCAGICPSGAPRWHPCWHRLASPSASCWCLPPRCVGVVASNCDAASGTLMAKTPAEELTQRQCCPRSPCRRGRHGPLHLSALQLQSPELVIQLVIVGHHRGRPPHPPLDKSQSHPSPPSCLPSAGQRSHPWSAFQTQIFVGPGGRPSNLDSKRNQRTKQQIKPPGTNKLKAHCARKKPLCLSGVDRECAPPPCHIFFLERSHD